MKNKIIQIIKEQINLDLGLHKSAWKYPHVKGGRYLQRFD